MDSTLEHVRGLAKATNVSSRGEYDEDGWVPTGGVVPWSLRFLGGLVLASASSGISISLVWEKSTIGQTMVPISPSETLCIVSSSMMCPSRSGVFDKLVSEFSSDLT